MSILVRLRGYAIRFGESVKIDGRWERFNRGAFAHLEVNRSKTLPVKCDSYGSTAETIGEVVAIFEDKNGLGFSADVSPEWAAIIGRKGLTRASVFFRMLNSRVDFDLGVKRETILKADLDDIAICGDGAVYKNTIVWRADNHAAMSKQNPLVAAWAKGLHAAAEETRRTQRPIVSKKDAGIDAYFTARRSEIEGVRAYRKNNPSATCGQIYGHIAFSKRADRFFK